MDACLMAMIEGARELAPFADYFIGSQEVEPMDGWPYALILQALNAEPSMAPAALADRIVREFAVSYNAATRAGEETVTQSAIALANTSGTEDLVKTLVAVILARQDDASLRSLVRECAKNTRAFQDKNYRDLGDFAARLVKATEFEFFPDVTAAAKALAEQLNAAGMQRPCYRWPSGPSTRARPVFPSMCRVHCSRAFSVRRRWSSTATCSSRKPRVGTGWWSGSTASPKRIPT